MKKLSVVLAIAMVLFIGVTGLSAQAIRYTVRATVPFSFTVGRTTLPAGDYVFTSLNDNVIKIQSVEDNKSTLALTGSVGGGNPVDPKLVFHRIEDRYFLAQVYLTYSATGRGLSASSAEAKLLQSQVTPQVTIIAAK